MLSTRSTSLRTCWRGTDLPDALELTTALSLLRCVRTAGVVPLLLDSVSPLKKRSVLYLACANGHLISPFCSVSLLKPGSSAIIALIFGEYLNRLFFHATSSDPTNLVEIPEWSFKLTATLAVLLVSVVNLVNARMGTGVQVVLTVIKVGAIRSRLTRRRGRIESKARS